MIYYFCLGRENKISQKEVECVLANFGVYFSSFARTTRSSDILRSEGGVGQFNYSISILSQEVLEIKSDFLNDEVAKKLIEVLGGTIKIFKRVSDSVDEIVEILSKDQPSGKLVLGVSNYSKNSIDTFKFGLGIKKKLKGKVSVRVIPPKDGDRLSSAQSFQYHLDKYFVRHPRPDRGSTDSKFQLLVDSRLRGNDKQKTGLEFGIFDSGMGQLVAVQNISFWSEIDYGKPRSDAKSGMLPPKLARMMINLAVGETKNSNIEARNSKQIRINKIQNPKHSDFDIRISDLRSLVVDPFCGSGNILMQALILGFPVLGVDISEKAVEDSKANILWLISNFKLLISNKISNDKCQILKYDVTKFNFDEIDRNYVVVTEPNLGKPRKEKFAESEVEYEAENIIKLYKKFFENLAKTKNQPLAICMVFPILEMKNGESCSILSRLLDFLSQIGYIISYPPLKYGRADQIIKREIVLLKIRNPKFETNSNKYK